MRSTMRCQPQRVKQPGFTLIELVAVVAMLAILSALLFPIFARAGELGDDTSCRSNLQKIGTALRLYTQDFDGKLIRSHYEPKAVGDQGDGPSDAKGLYKWMDALKPYVKGEKIFDCPTQKTFAFNGGGPYKYRDGTNYGSYGINASYWDPTDKLKSPAGEFVSMSDVKNPAAVVWVADANGKFEFTWKNKDTPVNVIGGTPPRLFQIEGRHANMSNILYLDGHVKAVDLNELAKKDANGVLAPFTIDAHS